MKMIPFEEFDRIFERILHGMAGTRSPIYGYQMSMGTDGVPRIREFGNISCGVAGSAGNLAVDVIEDEKSGITKLVAEIPGVEKEDIDISLDEDTILIRASREGRKYEGHVPVRNSVDPKQIKAAYRNGILEVTIPVENRPKGHTVRVD